MVRSKKEGIDVAGKLQIDENAVCSPYEIVRLRPVHLKAVLDLCFLRNTFVK